MDDLITLGVLKARMRRALNSSEDMDMELMAKIAGVSVSTIRRYNDPTSSVAPGLLSVARVAQYYGQSLDALVFGAGREDSAAIDREFRQMTEYAASNLTIEQKRAVIDIINVLSAGNFGLKESE